MKSTLLIITLSVISILCKSQTVTDIDGNAYNTVTIGEQVWMKENLKVLHFNDGTPIPELIENQDWNDARTPAYCWYGNDSAYAAPKYGAMYNGYVATNGNVCPTGWHVPKYHEFDLLREYLGGRDVAGEKLKKDDPDFWYFPDNQIPDPCGFDGLPGGFRRTYGFFGDSITASFWSDSLIIKTFNNGSSTTSLHASYIQTGALYFGYTNNSLNEGDYIRCIKDKNSDTTPPSSLSPSFLNLNSFYPNPAKDKLYLKSSLSSDASIQILNIQGKQILNTRLSSNIIDIAQLQKGVYLVKLSNAGIVSTQMIVKE